MEKLITEETRTKCFIGIEAEGPNRGSSVLFVPGSVSPERLQKVLNKNLTFSRIYYGAGNDRTIQLDTLSAIFTFGVVHQEICVDIEVSSICDIQKIINFCDINSIKRNGHLILFLKQPNEYKELEYDYLKYLNDSDIVWKSTYTRSLYVTALNDPLFELDNFVE